MSESAIMIENMASYKGGAQNTTEQRVRSREGLDGLLSINDGHVFVLYLSQSSSRRPCRWGRNDSSMTCLQQRMSSSVVSKTLTWGDTWTWTWTYLDEKQRFSQVRVV